MAPPGFAPYMDHVRRYEPAACSQVGPSRSGSMQVFSLRNSQNSTTTTDRSLYPRQVNGITDDTMRGRKWANWASTDSRTPTGSLTLENEQNFPALGIGKYQSVRDDDTWALDACEISPESGAPSEILDDLLSSQFGKNPSSELTPEDWLTRSGTSDSMLSVTGKGIRQRRRRQKRRDEVNKVGATVNK